MVFHDNYMWLYHPRHLKCIFCAIIVAFYLNLSLPNIFKLNISKNQCIIYVACKQLLNNSLIISNNMNPMINNMNPIAPRKRYSKQCWYLTYSNKTNSVLAIQCPLDLLDSLIRETATSFRRPEQTLRGLHFRFVTCYAASESSSLSFTTVSMVYGSIHMSSHVCSLEMDTTSMTQLAHVIHFMDRKE